MRGASEWGHQSPCPSGTLAGAAADPKALWCRRWDLVSGFLKLTAFLLHLEILMIAGAEHTPRLPQCWAKSPGEQASPGMLRARQAGSTEQGIPASPEVHLARCGARWQSPLCSNLRGKLLGTQRAWKPRVPICQPGKCQAAEEPQLPAPAGWSWEAGEHPAGHWQESQQAWQGLESPHRS